MPRHIVPTRRARACCRRLNIPASLRRRLSVPPRWFYPLGLWGEDDALTAPCHDGAIRVLRLAERYRACKTSRESILDADGGQFCAPINTPRLRDLQATWRRKHGVEGRCRTPSRPGEFHPEPLTEPDMRLSPHPARATQRRLAPSGEKAGFLRSPVDPTTP